jgi:hypothetical protein
MKPLTGMALAGALALAGGVLARAEEPAKGSYTLAAGDYLFVMLREGDPPLTSSTRRAYPSSGMYRHDGSVTPLWTVDWYAAEAYAASDGEHVAALGAPPPMRGLTRDLSATAVAFYERGTLLHSYDVGDLVQEADDLPIEGPHFQWKRQVVFDALEGRLAIRTLDGQTWQFDVATGEMMSQKRSGP